MSSSPLSPEQMYIQLAEQINILTNENSIFKQQLQQQQQQQQQQQVSQHQQSTSSSISSSVNNSRSRFAVPQPSKVTTFHGDTRKANLFLVEVESYWDAVGGDEANPGELSKVIFVASHLSDGAAIWWQNIKQVYSDKGEPIRSYSMFKQVFIQNYQPILASEAARAKLRRLVQREVPGGVNKYIEIFTSTMLSINDKSAADQMFDFMNGLSADINKIVDMQNPKTLNEAQLYAIKAEANNQKIYIANRNKQTNNQQSNKQQHNNNNNNQQHRHRNQYQYQAAKSNNQSESTPMDLSNVNSNEDDEDSNSSNSETLNYTRTRVSPEEFARCMKLRICLVCKKPGHIARGCPSSKK